MSDSNDIVCLSCSDLHLSHTPPIARSCEKNWYGVMEWQLLQLQRLKEKCRAPIIYAGDIFNVPDNPAELVNFAINNLPNGLSIPGQHDLPFHNYKDIQKSSYWTLVEAGNLINLEPYCPRVIGYKDFCVVGFPWMMELRPWKDISKQQLLPEKMTKVAVIHKYCWKKEHKYKDAPDQFNYRNQVSSLDGFDVSLWGDNHDPWFSTKTKPIMINNGCFIRRKLDELKYRPRVGIIHKRGEVEFHYLDTSEEKFIENKTDQSSVIESKFLAETEQFVEKLKEINTTGINFISTVERFLQDNIVSGGVRDVIIKAISEVKNVKKKSV